MKRTYFCRWRSAGLVALASLGVCCAPGVVWSGTIDRLNLGNSSSETAHSVIATNAPSGGTTLGETRRKLSNASPDGTIKFTMAVDGAAYNYATVRYWGNDSVTGRMFHRRPVRQLLQLGAARRRLVRGRRDRQVALRDDPAAYFYDRQEVQCNVDPLRHGQQLELDQPPRPRAPRPGTAATSTTSTPTRVRGSRVRPTSTTSPRSLRTTTATSTRSRPVRSPHSAATW